MKRVLLLLSFLLFNFIVYCQAPRAFNYQAVVRDASGEILRNHEIALKVLLLEGASDGKSVYSEWHRLVTNNYGLINLEVGKGDYPSSSFKDINWGSGNYFIKLEIDVKGGTDFVAMGASQLLSVPYALYASKSGTTTGVRYNEWGKWGDDVFTGTGDPYPSGNVGIGTRITEGKLTVQNNAGYTSVFRRVNNSQGNALFLFQKARGSNYSELPVEIGDHLGQVRFEGYYGGDYQPAAYIRSSVEALSGGTVKGNLRFATMNDGGMTEQMRITSTGNVGLGTIDPQATLDVIGTFRYADGSQGIDKVLKTNATGQTTWETVSKLETDPVFVASPSYGISTDNITDWNTAYGWGNHADAGYLTSESDPKIASSTSNAIPKWDGSELTDGTITDNGNIGVGVTNPNEKLEVNGNIKATTMYADAYSSNSPLQLQTNGTTQIYVDDTDGNVGVGTTVASQKLEVNGNIKTAKMLLTDENGSEWELSVDPDGTLQLKFHLKQCGDSMYDKRDGRWYQTVEIGTQCWMKENLNVGTKIISTTSGQLQTDNGVIEKYCLNNDESNCDMYGGLYEWNEMMQYITSEGVQGICPDGWHIPTDNEWKILEGTVDSQYGVGDPEWEDSGPRGFDAEFHLKSTTGWTGWINIGSGDDIFGFSALAGGNRNVNGNFYDLDFSGSFWSSTESLSSYAWCRKLTCFNDGVDRYGYHKASGLSVRCLKDD